MAAGRDVVHDRVPGDVAEGVMLVDVAAGYADDDRELGLPVHPGAGIRGDHHGVAGATDRRRRQQEEVGLPDPGGSSDDAHLAQVVNVVGTSADQLAR